MEHSLLPVAGGSRCRTLSSFPSTTWSWMPPCSSMMIKLWVSCCNSMCPFGKVSVITVFLHSNRDPNKDTWEGGIPTEELLSEWPVAMSPRDCLGWWLIWECPFLMSGTVHRWVKLGYVRKPAEHKLGRDPEDKPGSSVLQGFCLSSAWIFLSDGLWPRTINQINLLFP